MICLYHRYSPYMFKRAPKRKTAASSYSLHNTVKLVRGGQDYFDLLETMIIAAKYSIHVQVYIFDEDETGKRIARALIEAAVRGVKVYILVDGYASKNLSKDFIDNFLRVGISFRRFEPILKSKSFYFGRRLHHKVVVTDAIYCLVAGLNISDRYNDVAETKAWLDWALYAGGDVAATLAKVCIRRYKARLPNMEAPINPTPLKISGGEKDCAVRVRINDWVSRKREITNSYLEMLQTATSHIIIMSPYFLPGELIRRRIREAVNRGVRIRVIQAGISDIGMSKYAERYLYRWLFKNKVEIFEYQKTVLHGKIAVCDGQWMTVGSYNLNNLSAYASIELNLDVNSPLFAKKVERRLQEVIETDCVQITEEDYNKRTNVLVHVLQKISYNLLRMALFLFTFYFKQRE